MKDVKIVFNEKIYETYYDLLVHKITDDTSRKHYIALKNDCIILTNEEGIYFNTNEKDVIINLDIYKAKEIYKIDRRVLGIYIFPSSDYQFYFLDKQEPINSREKGIRPIKHIILLRYYKWDIKYGNKRIDVLPSLFANTELKDYTIKPNTILTIDENRNVKFIENINTSEIIDKYKSVVF